MHKDGAGCDISFLNYGTCISIRAYGHPDTCEAALLDAREACDEYEQLLSRVIEGSDVWRLNHAEGHPIQLDPRSAELLRASIEYCKASRGSFDISVGPLVAIWDVREGRVPSDDEIAAARAHVDYKTLYVYDRGKVHWAQLRDPKASIDLGGIAKGWIADRLCDMLEESGVTGSLVNLGGNVCVRGSKPDGTRWKIGIRNPFGNERPDWKAPVIELAEGSVVTSGTYERFFEKDGECFSHVLDPNTGRPITVEAVSVSVIAQRSIDAEGFSTTFLALGLEASREIAACHPEILDACFVYPDGEVRWLRR